MALSNPLLQPWDTPYGLPPFAAVRPEHFAPAFEQALKEHIQDMEAIAQSTAEATFENTVAAFDRSGRLYQRIAALFHNLNSSETSPALQAVQREMAGPLAAHHNAVFMHPGVFKRLEALYEQRSLMGLTDEQRRLLERVHLDFVRAGAKLSASSRQSYADIMERLAVLTTRFGQNILADESEYRLVLRDESELAGLPGFVRAAARQAAMERGIEDACVITLARSHIVPFLTFSDRRDLREQAWRAWTSRGEHDGDHDNRPVVREILALRREQARLHGKACFADYALADTMAGNQAAVSDLLQKVWEKALVSAAREREALQALVRDRQESLQIEVWDWFYYAEKLRQERYELEEAEVKPYFPLERMLDALFDCAQRLFGLVFVERSDITVYHPDVKVYEVRRTDQERDQELVGLFLHDNFARSTKRSGAWMSSYRGQSRNASTHGEAVLPVIVNNNNLAKGAPGEPTLLSFDDARTLFHEFGHGLHGLLSNVTYERLTGTNVLRDFVELPSQLFEHWLSEPQVLKRHARHWQTNEEIPDALLERLLASRRFNQGFETVRYTASAWVDLSVHALPGAEGQDICAFESEELKRHGWPSGLGLNHRLVNFQHLFAGSSYAAGYYVYLWAEVLSADAYEAFVEAGDPFDADVATRLEKHIYSVGNSREPGEAYRSFRGRDASVEPMLRERGLLSND